MEKTRDVGTEGLGIERQRDGEKQGRRERGTVGWRERRKDGGIREWRNTGTWGWRF